MNQLPATQPNPVAEFFTKLFWFIVRFFYINSLQVIKAFKKWLIIILVIGALITFVLSGNPDPVVSVEKGKIALILLGAVVSVIPTWVFLLFLWNIFHWDNAKYAWTGNKDYVK